MRTCAGVEKLHMPWASDKEVNNLLNPTAADTSDTGTLALL